MTTSTPRYPPGPAVGHLDPPFRPRLRGRRGELISLLGTQIGSGQLKPGTIIDPDELGRQFGVSRTVVREAFQVLVAKGMLEPRPRVGTKVADREKWDALDHDVIVWQLGTTIVPQDLTDLLELGQRVEPLAARRAALASPSELGPALSDICDRFQQRLTEDEFDGYCDADVEFHALIAQASGSALFRQLSGTIAAVMTARNRLGDPDEIMNQDMVDWHRRIANAIGDGDAETAEQLMSQMLGRARRSVDHANPAA